MMKTIDDPLHPSTPASSGLLLPVSIVGTLMGLLVIAVMLLVMFKVQPEANSVPRLVDGKTPEEVLAQRRTEATKRLSSYGWVDKAQGVAHIPLDVAMEKFLIEQASSPKSASDKK